MKPVFKNFLPLNIGRINLYLPEVIALEMRLLFMEVYLYSSFTFIENFIESTIAMFAFYSSRGQFKLPIIPRNVNKVTSTAGYKVTCYFIFLPPITRLNKNPAFKTGLTELPILANASLALSTLEGCLFTVNARAMWEQNSTEIPTAWNKRTRQKIKAVVTFKGSLRANNEMRDFLIQENTREQNLRQIPVSGCLHPYIVASNQTIGAD